MKYLFLKKQFLQVILMIVLFGSCLPEKKAVDNEHNQPNLLFIFADQYRRASVGFLNEDPVSTPNIDKLAKDGVFFSRAVSNYPLCSPYRAMLMTGKYPLSNGVLSNCHSGRTAYGNYLKKDEICFSDVLVSNGYTAGYVGKWHLDGPKTTEPGENKIWDTWCPPDCRHGFSFWYAYGTHNRHNNPYYWTTDAAEDEKTYVKQWSPEHEADVIIDYLKNGESQREVGKPFALFWSINPPHTPFDQVPEKYTQAYAGQDYMTVLNRLNVQFADNKKVKRGDRGVDRAIDKAPDYFASVNGVDDQIGRVITELKERGLYDNTIIVFTSDHGEMLGSHGLMYKNVWFSEAYDIPLIVHYPKKIKPDVEDLLISVPDYMPTMLGLMGLENKIPNGVEGRDYSDVFYRKPIDRPAKQLYFGSEPSNPGSGARGFRNNKYTFAVVKDTKGGKHYYLYHDQEDPYQQKNIWGENPSLDNKMESELDQLLKNMNDPW